MKKTLIALAALGVVGAASAQVTVSGGIDLAIQNIKGAAGGVTMTGGRNITNNVTFSAKEDLGGGMSAGGMYSISPTGDSGAAGQDPVFGGNGQYVNLAGGFGDIKMGYWLKPTFAATQTANSTKGVTGFTARAGQVDSDGVYQANQVLYTSPSISGLTFQYSYAPSEAAATAAETGLMLGYSAGALSVNYAMNDTAAAGQLSLLSGSYDMGAAKIFATMTSRDTGSTTNLGVTIPFGAVTVWADNTQNKITNITTTQLGAKYALSKRTTVYGAYGTQSAAANGMNIGISTTF
jgi:predicted porin